MKERHPSTPQHLDSPRVESGWDYFDAPSSMHLDSFSEKISEAGSKWLDAMREKHQDTLAKNEFYDKYGTGVKSIAQLEKLSPVEQLAYMSTVWGAAETDVGYAVREAKDIFDGISDSDKFPPLVRVAAEAAKSSNPNDPSGEDYDFEYGEHSREHLERYGYDSIIYPEQILLSDEHDSISNEELESTINDLEAGRIDVPPPYADYWSYHDSLIYELEKRYFFRNQEKLHQEFPNLPKDKQLVKIAPDAAATIEFQKKLDEDSYWSTFGSSIDTISDRNGHSSNSDAESTQYFKIVHGNKFMKSLVEQKLGIKLVDVPLESQAQLLKFMAEADNARFDSLCSTLHKVEPELRLKLAEGFLATDFGDDFGDSLLDIANSERISSEQLEEILDQISSCRESIKGITGLYKDFDGGEFAKEYSRAANERLTDVITVFKEIATRGEAAGDLGWAGELELNYDAAMEALKYETDSLAIINGTMGDVISGKDGAFAERFLSPDAQHTRSMYNFYSPDYGYVMLYTRPEGTSAFDPTIEYGKYRNRYDEEGKNVGAEASISMIVNPVNPFELPNPYRPDRHKVRNLDYYDDSTMNKVSAIRIDREGRDKSMSHDDENRSPINENGLASVDLAAIGDRADTPSGKIARLISVGNQLRENAAEDELSLNHNVIGGDDYGKASEFKKLVDYIDKSAAALCAIHPPSRTEGFTGAKRAKKQRERARKAMNRAA